MKNLIAIVAIVLIVGLAIRYIIKSRKKGVKCIGCPMAGSCQRYDKGQCSDNSL